MISIYDIKSWSDVAAFLIWTLAVCAIAKAVFGSLLAAEIHYRLALRDAPRRQRVNRLNWEINNRIRWNDDAVRNSPHAARSPLSDDELEAKRRDLRLLTKASFGARALQYFMGCFACQAFWTALAVFALTRGAADITAWLFTAAAYAGATIALSLARGAPAAAQARQGERKPVCKDCGS